MRISDESAPILSRLGVIAYRVVVRPLLVAAVFLASAVAARGQTGQTEAPPSGWRFVWSDHPSIRAGNWLRLDLRARFQGDLRRSDAFVAEDEDVAVDLAKRRVGVEGRVGDVADFQVEYELREFDQWRDVYVDYRQFTVVRAQAGKFKLPFGLEENISATNLDFVYRSRVSRQLAPGRDRGVMLHGSLLRNVVNYEAGVFAHDGDNGRPRTTGRRRSGDRTTAFRVTVDPFRASRSPLRDFQFAVATAASDLPEGYSSMRGRASLGAEFFESDIWVQGTRRRTGVEMRWRPGPFSVQSEYIRVTDERRGQSVENTDLSPLLAQGWYLSGTWAVTGERKSRGLGTPDHPFLRGGAGAFELAGRVEALRFGSLSQDGLPSTSPRPEVIVGNADRAVTIGVNWYLNPWIKIQGNLIHETIEDPSQGPLPDRPGFWSRAIRLQLTL